MTGYARSRRLLRLERLTAPPGRCPWCDAPHVPDVATLVRLQWAGSPACRCAVCVRGCGALWRGLRAELDGEEGGRDVQAE